MKKTVSQRKAHLPISDKLKALYAVMDQKYQEAAEYYSFHCRGCEDNCCLTRFYHHTFLEYIYLLNGFDKLDPGKQAEVKQRASEVCRKTAQANEKGTTVRIMCPLNSDGLCILYHQRPMICRLHGISHEFRKPGGDAVYGPGCEAFTKQAEGRDYFKFDRTPLYIEMSRLEAELKETLGIDRKLKMTVAEMLTYDL
ncbi:hypothetical protein QUF80_12675 [Desulfococcaceae bacterium HSG8]|nr:hypothetical protein [Desulfococcaceae bacterium HSG8]